MSIHFVPESVIHPDRLGFVPSLIRVHLCSSARPKKIPHFPNRLGFVPSFRRVVDRISFVRPFACGAPQIPDVKLASLLSLRFPLPTFPRVHSAIQNPPASDWVRSVTGGVPRSFRHWVGPPSPRPARPSWVRSVTPVASPGPAKRPGFVPSLLWSSASKLGSFL